MFSRLGHWWHHSKQAAFTRHVGGEFARDDCFASAGSLTYATLLSLVPILSLIGAMAVAMPGSDAWGQRIIGFLNDNFLALADDTMRGEVTDRLQEFATNTKGLTWTMGVFLIFSSIMLITNIERALNRIWGVQTPRSWVNRFVMYWSTLTFGPILLGASLALSSYFFSLDIAADLGLKQPLNGEQYNALQLVAANFVQLLTPLMVSAIAFFMLFVIVPNRQVSWRHAIGGALLTALMFELAKKGFGWYVGRSETYGQIYGALAVIPIFLVWIYVSWTVILLGASFTASIESFRFRDTENRWPAERHFVLLYRLVGHFYLAQRDGRGLTIADLLQAEPFADDHQIQTLLESLRLANILRRDEDGEWLLVRDLDSLSLAELYATGRYVWPLDAEPVDQDNDAWNEALTAALDQVTDPLEQISSRSLKSFYQDSSVKLEPVGSLPRENHAS